MVARPWKSGEIPVQFIPAVMGNESSNTIGGVSS